MYFIGEELGFDGISSTVWQSNIKLNNIILGLVVFEVVENAKLVSDSHHLMTRSQVKEGTWLQRTLKLLLYVNNSIIKLTLKMNQIL